MTDTLSTIESATGAAQFIGSQLAKYYGGVVGQAAATYLLGEVSWTASTTDLAAKLHDGTATGEDVAEVFSKTASTLAGFGVLAGIANPVFLTVAGAAAGLLFAYENFVPNETKITVWDTIFDSVFDGINTSDQWFTDLLNEAGNALLNFLLPKGMRPIDIGASTFFTSAQKFRFVSDPLTLDLDGDGLETTGIAPNAPILFDHNADGIKTGSGWVSADDGMLVLDRNGNGSIDSGLELFGDSTVKSNGQLALDGFDALADLDSNADGQISSADAQFAGLQIWRDLNQDGISQGGELFTLASLGIASISTAKTANSQTLANGNQIADLGTYTRTDGSTGTSGDMSGRVAAQQRGTHRPTPCGCNLAADTFHREFTDTLDTSAVSTLPDMQACPERSRRGSGVVRDLREAANDKKWWMAA